MSTVAGYELHELLDEGGTFRVFRGRRVADRVPVVVKVPAAERPTPRDLARLRNEFEIVQSLDGRFVIRAHELISWEGTWALVLEDIGGVAVARALGRPMKIGRFLKLASRIAEALDDIHHRGIVHRDIKPHNIIIAPGDDEVRLTDFGASSVLPREHQAAAQGNRIEGSLAYMAPEQTGRMNHAVDFRADLYALGVTFYEMLTGSLPFSATDPLEWLHCHIAREPVAPAAVCAHIPVVLSDIVMKLLRKNAEERYQSAYGLTWDLERCLAAWRAVGRVTAFPLGERDALDRLDFPQKLYGRGGQLRELSSGFERVAGGARAELLLVSGYAGCGKSSFVMELAGTVLRERGFFVRGKFDQYQRNIPYATITQAIVELTAIVLTESEDRLPWWREQIQAAVGAIGQLIVELIPAVERVIGPQPPVPPLSPVEAQHRFNAVFHSFLSVFATRDHPLVLFMDDMQWIDHASLSLVESLLVDGRDNALLLIGAYRDNEVDPAHPLMTTLRTVRDGGVPVTEIALSPLGVDDINQLMADVLHAAPAAVRLLSRGVLRKTGGNPFFVKQLLIRQHLDGLISFDHRNTTWSWDLDAIESSAVTDNIVDLLNRRLKELSPDTRSVLEVAACIGGTFELDTLATVLDRTPEGALASLRPAIDEDIVLVRNDGDRLCAAVEAPQRRTSRRMAFGHDRIQQAAYAMIPDGERTLMHLRIGRALLSAASEADRQSSALFLADQLNRAINLVTDASERFAVAELNLTAGKKAKRASAYSSAESYLEVARRCVAEGHWSTHHAFMVELYRESAEVASVLGHREAAEELAWKALGQTESVLDKADLYKLLIEVRTMIHDYPGAIELGRDGLALLGVELPRRDFPRIGAAELAEAKRRLGDRAIASLVDVPLAQHPATRAIGTLLAKLINAACLVDADLWQITTAKLVNLSLTHGNVVESAFGYAAFSHLLGSRLGERKTAYELCLVAMKLTERWGDRTQKCIVCELFGGHINHWYRHVRTSYDIVMQGYLAGFEVGCTQFASYANGWRAQGIFYQGVDLSSVLSEVTALMSFSMKVREGVSQGIFQALRGAIASLRGERRDVLSLDTDDLGEQEFVAACERTRSTLSLCLFYIHKMMVLYIYREPGLALACANKAEALLPSLHGAFADAQYVFYRSLILAAMLRDAPPESRADALEVLSALREQMKRWADSCPENFGDKLLLIEAELARLGGRAFDAMRLYRDAVKAAMENEFIHEEALAYELSADLYREEGFDEIAELHLRKARACYARWGADGKVRQLIQRYPSLASGASFVPTATCILQSEQLDLLAVTRAAQCISREMSLPRLHQILIRTVIEHAGAQRGHLVTMRGGAYFVQARGAALAGGIEVETDHCARPLGGELPRSILNYVQRTRGHLLLVDASAAPAYAADPYVARERPRSVLCMPIQRQGELVGMLYLENNLVVGAFTIERVAALDILASQAAISLENAALYSSLEESQERLQSVLDNTPSAIYMKDREGRYLLLNRHMEDVFRLKSSQIIGKTDYDLFSREQADHFRTTDLQVLSVGAPLEWEQSILHADGYHAYLSVKFPIYDRSGTAYAVCGISTDITEHKRSEAERLGALERERAALASREEFLTLAAHELRTPLTPIKLYLSALSRRVAGSGRPELREPIAKVTQKVQEIEDLAETLLDFAGVSEGQQNLKREPCDLAALVRDVAASSQGMASAAGSVLRLNLEGPVPGLWDRRRMQQVVRNLLSNAAKYGCGKPIDISVERAGELAVLVVADQGIGIDQDKQLKIFERFTRGVSIMSYGGLGLGLYVVRQIVEAHGGHVSVRSAPNAGASFSVELPLVKPADGPSPRQVARRAGATAPIVGREHDCPPSGADGTPRNDHGHPR